MVTSTATRSGRGSPRTSASRASRFSVETISGGRSNLTLGVEAGGRRLVVRRPPIGHFLPTAHDMSREYRVYRALHGTGVPVPEAYALCEDESVIGAPFYVMERLDGIVPHEPADLATADAAAERADAVLSSPTCSPRSTASTSRPRAWPTSASRPGTSSAR